MNKILLVVDMQNDFITGPLGSDEAVEIVPMVARKVDLNLRSGVSVWFTMDTHWDDDYLSSREGKYLPIKHCIEGTEGHKIHPEIYKFINEINPTLVKEKYDFAVDWWYEVHERGSHIIFADIIEIVGLCTDICVVSNALVLRQVCKDIPIVVDASCCAGTTPEKHKAALEVMKSCQIEVVNE